VADGPDQPVYLLTGSDRPKIHHALERLRRHFAPEAVETVSAVDTSGEAAVALCNAGSLFGDARLVVVEQVDGVRGGAENRLRGGWKAADVAAVVAYLGSPAPDTVLALVGEDVKKTTALAKACAKAGSVLEFSVAKGKLHAWVAARFAEHGVRAEPDACAVLIQLVGDDLDALASEIDKLATWAAGEPIGEREVTALVAPSADLPIWELTDAWGARDSARALAVTETLFENDPKPRRDVAPRLAGALGNHVSRLRAMKRQAARGHGSKEAAAELKLNPYFASKLFSQAEGFTDEELGDAVVRLAELDGALKGQSKLTPDLEVQRTLVALTSRPGAPARVKAEP
jgi:DNA polymerase-3 subunit delta